MRIAAFDEVCNLPPGRLFAILGDLGPDGIYVKGENGPQGQLRVRRLFELTNVDRQALNSGGTAVVREGGFAWLQGVEEKDFLVFERRDLECVLPQITRAARGWEVTYQGGSLDGMVEWVDELPPEIPSEDKTTTPFPTAQMYFDTGSSTAEGYRIFRVNKRRK